MTNKEFHPWYEYVYDEYLDIVICPEYKSSPYRTTNRDEYQEYKSLSYVCEQCSTRGKCTTSRRHEKTVTRHIWSDCIVRAEDVWHSPEGKGSYRLHSQTIERVFANTKEK